MARLTPNSDLRDLPLYGQREAAHILGLSPSTLRGWASESTGGSLLRLPEGEGGRLSFNNLVEAYVLRSLRRKHAVTVPAIRRALDYAERELGVSRLLLRQELRWSGDLFWDELSTLINLSESGQLAMREVVDSYLNRVEWDEESNLPVRLFPRVISEPAARSVVIDPRVSFGQPTVAGIGVATAIIAQRFDAGESLDVLAADYSAPLDALKHALVYEGAG